MIYYTKCKDLKDLIESKVEKIKISNCKNKTYNKGEYIQLDIEPKVILNIDTDKMYSYVDKTEILNSFISLYLYNDDKDDYKNNPTIVILYNYIDPLEKEIVTKIKIPIILIKDIEYIHNYSYYFTLNKNY